MSFTNEDLKRLKEKMQQMGSGYIDSQTLNAILARLEVAEAYARAIHDCVEGNDYLYRGE